MPVTPRPDTIGAIVARLRSFAEILAFVTTAAGYTAAATAQERTTPRVSGRLQSYWQLSDGFAKGGHALLVHGPVGQPAGDEPEFDVHATRVDLHCYGPNPFEAMRLWRTVDAALIPTLGTAAGFDAASVRVGWVTREGGPTSLIEPQTNYTKVVATYVAVASGVAVA